MEQALTINAVIIVCVAILGGAFKIPMDEAPRWFCTFWCGWVAVALSLFGWGIYVAVHFIGKYW